MPTCGNCGKNVSAGDVTCPHCGVLLAAYQSAERGGAAGTYEEPPASPAAEIADVDMDVKPPFEAEILIDPTEVAEEPISTAPRPLFATNLTVEDIAAVADGDANEDVVTVAEGQVTTKKVEFEVPDYARPPVNAAPIPTIDEDDDSVPLITRHSPDGEREASDPDMVGPGESWLNAPIPKPVEQEAPANTPSETGDQPEPRVTPSPAPAPEPSGPPARPTTTERARRREARLQEEAAESLRTAWMPRNAAGPAAPPAERGGRQREQLATQGQNVSRASTNIGCMTLYGMLIVILWFTVIVSVFNGNINPFLIFITVAATWGHGPVRRFIRQLNEA